GELPQIVDTVHIDGLTNEIGTDCPLPGPLAIQINDDQDITDGLGLGAGSDGSSIRGLSITNFNEDGIDIRSSNNTITCNYIGVAADGTTAGGNDFGVSVYMGGGNTIGGPNPDDGNVIAHSNEIGILLTETSGNLIQRNTIHNSGNEGISV